MMRKDLKVIDSKVLILGFTFKEDCPDVRNTRVIDIYNELKSFDVQVEVYDPWVNCEDVKHEYGIEVLKKISEDSQYSAVILAVAHEKFRALSIRSLVGESGVIYDVKGILPKSLVDARL
jgi:UDP-N-acetyl-D-galactosamine dehydrogenase